MNAQSTQASKNIIWNKKDADLVAAEFHRLLKIRGTSKKSAFEQCQTVLPEDKWKTIGSLQNYFYANKLHIGTEVSSAPSVPVVTPGAPLAKTPVSISYPQTENRQAIPLVPGNSLEEAIVNYVKQEISILLQPVRTVTLKIEQALNDQLAEISKPGGAIRYFARSLEEEEQDLLGERAIHTVASTLISEGTSHPLKHTVGIIGLVGSQMTTIKQQFQGSKLFIRFTDKDNNPRAVKSVKNMENILVMSSKTSHSLTKTLANSGLGHKTKYFNSMTDLSEKLRALEATL